MKPFTRLFSSKNFYLLLAVFLLIFGARLWLMEWYSYPTPYYDDWRAGAYLQLYKSGTLTLERLFSPFNGHIALWSNLSNFVFFEINSKQWDPQFHMLVNAAIWALSAVVLVRVVQYSKNRINVAVFVTVLICIWAFPISVINAFWGIQTHNYLMILLAISAIWLTSGRAWSRWWWLGFVLAAAAPLTMGGGAFVSIAIFATALIQFIVEPETRKQSFATIKASFIFVIWSVVVLKMASGGHDVYYAKSFSDFIKTLLKVLSFPLSKDHWSAPIMLLPIALLSWKALTAKQLNDRFNKFVITLTAYMMGIAFAIGYARGVNGWPPSDRYFEFLSLYMMVSGLALLALQHQEYRLSKFANSIVVFSWLAVFLMGMQSHVFRVDNEFKHREAAKNYEEDIVRRYLTTHDKSVLLTAPVNKLPFADGPGLKHFLDLLEPWKLLPHAIIVPEPLVEPPLNSGFKSNATVRPSTGERGYKYKHENVIGSFDENVGGMSATGVYSSQIFAKPKHPYLKIPVTGYAGYPDIEITLVDEVTREITAVLPKKVASIYAETWRDIYVRSPRNKYRLIVKDNNRDLWVGFAAPRNIGLLSMLTLIMMSIGHYVFILGLLVLAFLYRKQALKAIEPKI